MTQHSPGACYEPIPPERVADVLKRLLSSGTDTLKRLGEFPGRLATLCQIHPRRHLFGVDSHFTNPPAGRIVPTGGPLHVTVVSSATAVFHCIRLFEVDIFGTLVQVWPDDGSCFPIDLSSGTFDFDVPFAMDPFSAYVLKLFVTMPETEVDSDPFMTFL
jgi:hypothetical protein